MTWEPLFVLGLLAVVLILWVTEKLPLEVTALGGASALMISGVLTVEEAMQGFSNSATITVACMLILSGAVSQAGFTDAINRFLRRLSGSHAKPALLLNGLLCGVMSAFINNTASVALLMPASLRAAKRTQTPPGRFLLTISYLSQLGGMCTLIGTSTTLIVHTMSKDAGLPGFGFFTLLPLGALLLAVGGLYVLVADRQFPGQEKASEEPEQKRSSLGPFLGELKVLPDSFAAGNPIKDLNLTKSDVTLVRILRPDRHFFPTEQSVIEAGDVLVVRGYQADIISAAQKDGLVFNRGETPSTAEHPTERMLVEAGIPPGSYLAGKSLLESRFQTRFNCTVVGLRRLGLQRADRLGTLRLRTGDTVLIECRRDQLPRLKKIPDFTIEAEAPIPKRFHHPFALMAVVVMVLSLMVTGLVPVATSALLGVLVLMGLRLAPTEELLSFLHGKLLILLGCSFSFGYAAIKTGLAQSAADGLMNVFSGAHPWVFLVVLYLLTMALTEVISNNATAILLVPVALATADQLGVDPTPFLVAISLGASTSFMTPTGYQTNAMIYGPGNLRVKDYMRAGIPLNLLVFVVGIFTIPHFWPF